MNRAGLADVGGSWVDMVANVSELATEYIAHRANDFEIREAFGDNFLRLDVQERLPT